MFGFTQCVVGVDLGDQKSLACVYSQGVMTPDGVPHRSWKSKP